MENLIANENTRNSENDNTLTFNRNAYLQTEKKNFKIPQLLRKTFITTSLIFVCGIILLITGILLLVFNESGVTFIVLSSILLIPGTYYTIQFCRARCAKDSDKSFHILESIPQL